MTRLRRAALVAALCGACTAFGARAAGGLVWQEPGRVQAAPLFVAGLASLDHQPMRLVQQPGRPLIVNFWARWCGPCKVEIPELVALRERHPGVDVVGLALEKQGDAVRDFARAYDINYPLLLTRDVGLDLMRALGNTQASLPYTVVLDRQGAVVATRIGALTRSELDAAVQRAQR